MNKHVTLAHVNFVAASRFVELIAGPEASVWFRLIHDKDRSRAATPLYGTISEHWTRIENAQHEGFGVFVVVNEGGNKDVEITNVRAVFIDADNKPLPSSWHVQPDFIVHRDACHWHAYWIAREVSVADFPTIQKRLAAFYGTDRSVCNRSRVMRVPGLLHQKNTPTPVVLEDLTGGIETWLLGRGIDYLSAGLPELSTSLRSSLADKGGWPITRSCLEEKLRHIDPACDRNKWLAVAGAIKHAETHKLVTLADRKTPDHAFNGSVLFAAWSAGELK